MFASAADGWGFGLADFARLFAAKLGVDAGELQRCLWGDFYYHARDKKLLAGAQAKAKKPVRSLLRSLVSDALSASSLPRFVADSFFVRVGGHLIHDFLKTTTFESDLMDGNS